MAAGNHLSGLPLLRGLGTRLVSPQPALRKLLLVCLGLYVVVYWHVPCHNRFCVSVTLFCSTWLFACVHTPQTYGSQVCVTHQNNCRLVLWTEYHTVLSRVFLWQIVYGLTTKKRILWSEAVFFLRTSTVHQVSLAILVNNLVTVLLLSVGGLCPFWQFIGSRQL